jgi:hypothetical protein
MPRETAQERGREGARIAQRWLEATTFLELPLNSYKNENQCTLTCLDGSTKTFDLTGFFLDEDHTPISVEVKNVSTDNHLREQFHEFLATAYSSTARLDENRNFMWVSWHPFGPMTGWTQLTTPNEIQSALTTHSSLLNGRPLDLNVVQKVADRLWVLTFNEKQERLSLDVEDLQKAQVALQRRRSTL